MICDHPLAVHGPQAQSKGNPGGTPHLGFGEEQQDQHNKEELQRCKEDENPEALSAELRLEGLRHHKGHEHVEGGVDGRRCCTGLQGLHLCAQQAQGG